jgi:uncharacterized membrane protein
MVARVAAGIALATYPLVVWLGLSQQSPRFLALVLLLVMAPAAMLRLQKGQRSHVRGLAAIPLVTVLALAAAALLDATGCMLAVPVAINAVCLLAFALTLRRAAMPMIERFARLQEPELSVPQQAWCRTWTRIWCAFFGLNGSVAAALALWAPLSWWAFYNGMLAYGLIGALLAIEWLLRRRRFPRLPLGEGGC